MVDLDRTRIVRRLARGQSVELDWGLVLTPPKDPGARGAGGSYRWIFYDPPRREDGTLGTRVQRSSRRLDDQAWLRIAADLSALEASMVAQATGTRLDAPFEELARHWLEPARHPDWSADYAKKVHSVTTNWLLADTITIAAPGRGSRAGSMSLAKVPLGKLTAAIVIEALDHVRTQRAHGTYRAAHECATAIVGWGMSIKWLPLGQVDEGGGARPAAAGLFSMMLRTPR